MCGIARDAGDPVAEMADLAAEYGTPLFVYDEDHLRARCRESVEAFGDGVAYATKAFLCKAMARLAHEAGLPTVVTNDAHYALRSDRELQDVLVSIRHGQDLEAAAVEALPLADPRLLLVVGMGDDRAARE